MKILIPVFLSLLIACKNNRDPRLGGVHFPYVTDMRQGNIIDNAAIAKLQTGMSKEAVKQILGEPLLADTFHQNRWDYVQIERMGKKKPMQKSLSLFFNDKGLVAIRR